MGKASKRPQNKKLKAKQRKQVAKQKEFSQKNDDAVVNTLMQALKLHTNGQNNEAIALAKNVQQANPNHPEVYSLLGIISHRTDKPDEAVKYHRKSIELNPNNGNYYSNLGASLNKSGNPAEAVEMYKKALEILPDAEQIYFNMAIALRALGRLEEAIECYEKVLQLNPNNTKANYNLGNALEAIGQNEQALAYHEKVQKIDPTNAKARYNKALLNLRLGNLKEGFKDYELRWLQEDAHPFPERLRDAPIWDGRNLEGGSLLIYGEQGMGDVIQFIRYVKMAKEKYGVGTIFVRCHPQLYSLLSTVKELDKLLKDGEGMPEFDAFTPILSLPHIMGTELSTIPAEIPYLSVTKSLIEKWSSELRSNDFKIGIIWAGAAGHKNDHNRSCPLSFFESLMDIPGTSFYSLQKGRGEQELAQAMTRRDNLFDMGSKVSDFADTAAIMEHLDLVISVDTSPAHLAGALGRLVWTLLPFVPDWRWLKDRDDSPWYPTMKLFRQEEIGNWNEVFKRIHGELEKLIVKKKLEEKNGAIDIPSLLNKAIMLHRSDDSKEAEKLCRKVLEVSPNNSDACNILGMVKQDQGELDEAKSLFEKSLSIKPGDPRVLYNSSFIYLLEGDFTEGLKRYEHRFDLQDLPDMPDFIQNKPLWSGEDLHGKTILIHAEQGFGDVIQFIRYAKLLKERGAYILAECHAELLELLKQLKEVDEWLENGKPIPHFDFHIPIMSLPHAFGTTKESIPAEIPYLSATPERISRWKEFTKEGKIKIGFSWAGRKVHIKDKSRSCDLSLFKSLADFPNVTFYSLQKGRDEGLIKELSQRNANFIDLGSKIENFADSTAIVEQMDLIISVDTSLVHLAGAMGKPVWTLLPHVPDWRWMLNRTDSPWYPTMKLFRQGKEGDWHGIFGRVKEELANFYNNKNEINISIDSGIKEKDKHTLMDAMKYFQSGNLAKAEEICNSIIITGHETAEVYNFLCILKQKQDENDSAIELIKKALELEPDNENFLTNLGALFRKVDRLDDSLYILKKATEINPNNVNNLYYCAFALFKQEKNQEALKYLERVLAIDRTHYNSIVMAANIEGKLKHIDEAIEYYTRAIEIKPDEKENIYNRSLARLLLGNYKDGFADYEQRFGPLKYLDLPNVTKNAPMWDGTVLSEKTLFLHTEQGFGDALQFIRFVPMVKKFGGKVIVGCRRELHELLSQVMPEAKWVPEGDHVPPFDVHLPVMSLPRLFGTTLETIPKNIPYIKASEEKIEKWKPHISKDSFNIGIVWNGNPKFPENKMRSCPLEYYECFMDIPGTKFYSLQKGSQEKEIAELCARKKNIFDMGNKIESFSDTAAILSQLDLLISTDTSVPHLAGAMGVRSWVLLQYVPDWRWLLDREDCPWYPTMRLFRQIRPGEWKPVLTKVKSELEKLVRNGSREKSR